MSIFITHLVTEIFAKIIVHVGEILIIKMRARLSHG